MRNHALFETQLSSWVPSDSEELPENRTPHSIRTEDSLLYVCDQVVWATTENGTLVPIEVPDGAITAQYLGTDIVIQCANNKLMMAKMPLGNLDPPTTTSILLRKSVKSDEDEEQCRAYKADVQVVRKTVGASPRCSLVTRGPRVFAHVYSEALFVHDLPEKTVPVFIPPSRRTGLSEDIICAASAPADL